MAERVYGLVTIVKILYRKTVSGDQRESTYKISGAYKQCVAGLLVCFLDSGIFG